MSQTISPAQVEALLDFLSQHENLALGKVRGKEGNLLSNQLWEQCAKMLNKYPHGANRPADKWKKYYNQYKSRVKAKVRTMEQGGSENLVLTPLEQRLCKLVGENIWAFDSHENPLECQMVFAIVEPIKLIPSTRILQTNLTPPSKMLTLMPSNAHHSNKRNEDTIDEHVIKTEYSSDKEAETDMIMVKEECDVEKYTLTSNVDCEIAEDHQPSKITYGLVADMDSERCNISQKPRRSSKKRLWLSVPRKKRHLKKNRKNIGPMSVTVEDSKVTVEDPLLEPIQHHSIRLPGSFQSISPSSSEPPKKKIRSTSPTEQNDLRDINERLLALEQSRVEADIELARAMNRQSTAIEELLGLAKYFVNIYEKNNVQQSSTNNEQVPMQQRCQTSQINQQTQQDIEIEGLVQSIKKEME